MASSDLDVEDQHTELHTGISLLFLLLRSQTWVHRRVDSLRLDSEGTTRRHVSVDLTLPKERAIPGSQKRVIVPIAVLEKGVVRKLDASHAGKTISVLGRTDNGKLSIAMMSTAVSMLLSVPDEETSVLTSLLEGVVYADDLGEADAAFAAYKSWVNQQPQPEVADEQQVLAITHQVVKQLSRNFILFVELDEDVVGTRTTVKYALNQESPELERSGFKQVLFYYEVPDYGFAASHHVEVELPPGLLVSRMEIRESEDNGADAKVSTDPSTSRQRLGHVALNPSGRFLEGKVSVEVIPASQGLLLFTNVAVLCIVGMFVAAQLVRWMDHDILGSEAKIPSQSASILLIGPALLFSWMSRSPEHNLVVELLSPLRKILAFCALALVGTAILAALPVTPMVWNASWFIIGLLVAGAVLVLARYNKAGIEEWLTSKRTRISAWAQLTAECLRAALQCRSIRRHIE